MSVRQYIGARYVTKIYENSLDPSSAEWEASINYEPLTLVTYNYGSYLSKKEVPASIGNPADNPTYWAQTGFYNGQIAQIQNDIIDINNTINSLISGTVRRYILITDSYGNYTNADNKTIGQLFKEALNISDDDFYYAPYNGASFYRIGAQSTFEDALTVVTQSVTSPETITDIIVSGGANDSTNSAADTISAIESFVTYAEAHYPAARITLFNCGNYRNWQRADNLYDNMKAWQTINKYGGVYIDNASYLLKLSTLMINDGIHPSQDGIDVLARALIQGINTGSVEVRNMIYLNNSNIVGSPSTNTEITGYNTISAAASLVINQYNSIINFEYGAKNFYGMIQFSFDSNINMTPVPGSPATLIIKFDKDLWVGEVFENDTEMLGLPGLALDNNGKLHFINIMNINGEIYFQFNETVSSSEGINKITILSIGTFMH